MPVTVKVNGTVNSLVHKGSNGISMATIPDVCKTPSPAGPVPIPYPNISQSMTLDKGTTTVKADGGMMIATKGSEFSLSNGDNAGVAGGVKSSTFMKESTWILYSFDVKTDGQNACRLTDKKFQNHENTVDIGGTVQALVAAGMSQAEAEEICNAFCETQAEYDKGPPPKGKLQGSGCCSREFESKINARKKDGKLSAGIHSEESFFGKERLTPELANSLLDRVSPATQMPVIDKMIAGGFATTSGGAVTQPVAKALAAALRGGQKVPSGIVRPDLIVESGSSRTVFDAKFDYDSRSPGAKDTLSKKQLRAYRRLSKPEGKDPIVIDREGCNCGPAKT